MISSLNYTCLPYAFDNAVYNNILNKDSIKLIINL